MPSALTEKIAIELLIEGNRSELFQRIVSQVPTSPSGSDSRSFASIPGPVDNASSSSAEAGALLNSNISVAQTRATEIIPSTQLLHVNDKQDDKQDDLGFYYFVQDSYLSENGSERIFKVKHRTTEYYYRAFELKNRVVCPAFLASWFDTTDYACLDVINGFHYYYIFLDSKNDDALSHVFDKNSNFLGRFFFMEQALLKEKIFHLNSENKDLKVFIDIDDEDCWRKSVFHGELLEYRHTPGTVSKSSKVDPSYCLVPIKAVIRFSDWLPASIKSYPAAIVHRNSISYFEICKRANRGYLRREENEMRSVGREMLGSRVFIETDYKREEYIMEKFMDHIQRNFVDCRSKKVKAYYCPMISVIQSTGFGKSKLMLKLGSRMPVFYFSLQQGSSKFPYVSFFLTKLIEELQRIVREGVYTGIFFDYCWMNNVTTAVYTYILRIIYVILKIPQNGSLRESFQIDSKLEEHEFFTSHKVSSIDKIEIIFKILFRGLEDVCKCPQEIPFDGENTLDLKGIQIVQELSLNKFAIDFRPKEYLTNDLEGEVMALLESLKMKGTDLPSIFVIDGYHGLWCEETQSGEENYTWSFRDTDVNAKSSRGVYGRSPFNVFRRVFRMFSNTWERLMLIVTGTRGQASFLHPKYELDLCKLPMMASHRIIENFSLLQSYNANSDIIQSINANMFPNEEGICNWVDFLKSDFRKVEYFKFGRPLNYAAFRDLAFSCDLKEEFKDCREFKFIASKLFGDKKYWETDKIGLLYSMFNFAFGTNFLPSCVDREDLIENHLMTLMEFSNENGERANHIIGGFLPEGVINFLSASYFVRFRGSFSKLLSSSTKYGLCDNGNFTKFLAQFMLLHKIFDCIDFPCERVRKLVFQPVLLKDFLFRLAVVRDEIIVKEFFKLNPLLDDSLVSFGYFEHFSENPITNPFDLMARLLFRGSATTLNRFYPGIDLMIPLVLKDGGISFVGVKLIYARNEILIDEEVNNAREQMSFPLMFSGLQSDRSFCLIILVVGDITFDVSIIPRIDKGKTASVHQDPLVAPTILVFKGIPTDFHWVKALLEILLIDKSYCYIDPSYLKKCDRMHDLIKEIPSLQVRVSKVQNDSVTHPIGSKRSRSLTSSESVEEPSSE